jgi:hypothetical protein
LCRYILASRGRAFDPPKAARWASAFAHPTALRGCQLTEIFALDNVTRLIAWKNTASNVTSGACTIEDPGNALRCAWRRETQQFEGCGCEVTTTLRCACNHLTDFAASAAPPTVHVISAEQLTSITTTDVADSATVLFVAFGIFLATLCLVIVFGVRDRRALRRFRKRFFEGTAAEELRFAEVKGVWTWSCEMHDVKSMFLALYMTDQELEGSGKDINSLPKDNKHRVRGQAAKAEARFWEAKSALIKRTLFERGFGGIKVNLASPVFWGFLEKMMREDLRRDAPTLLASVNMGKVPHTESPVSYEIQPHEVLDKLEILQLLVGDINTTAAELHAQSIKRQTSAGEAYKFDKPLLTKPWTERDDRKMPGDERQFQDQVRRRIGAVREEARREVARRQNAQPRKLEETTNPSQEIIAGVEDMRIVVAHAAATGATCMRSDDGQRLDVQDLPTSGKLLCTLVGLNYVRLNVSFPLEALRRTLAINQFDEEEEEEDFDDSAKKEYNNPSFENDEEGVMKGPLPQMPKDDDDAKKGREYLRFNRAIGTAMVYAYLDVNNVVDHREMMDRTYACSKLPWLLPKKYSFVLLVSKFKRMMMTNLTTPLWMQRSVLWNLVAMQDPDGGYSPDDVLAGLAYFTTLLCSQNTCK